MVMVKKSKLNFGKLLPVGVIVVIVAQMIFFATYDLMKYLVYENLLVEYSRPAQLLIFIIGGVIVLMPFGYSMKKIFRL